MTTRAGKTPRSGFSPFAGLSDSSLTHLSAGLGPPAQQNPSPSWSTGYFEHALALLMPWGYLQRGTQLKKICIFHPPFLGEPDFLQALPNLGNSIDTSF